MADRLTELIEQRAKLDADTDKTPPSDAVRVGPVISETY